MPLFIAMYRHSSYNNGQSRRLHDWTMGTTSWYSWWFQTPIFPTLFLGIISLFTILYKVQIQKSWGWEASKHGKWLQWGGKFFANVHYCMLPECRRFVIYATADDGQGQRCTFDETDTMFSCCASFLCFIILSMCVPCVWIKDYDDNMILGTISSWCHSRCVRERSLQPITTWSMTRPSWSLITCSVWLTSCATFTTTGRSVCF